MCVKFCNLAVLVVTELKPGGAGFHTPSFGQAPQGDTALSGIGPGSGQVGLDSVSGKTAPTGHRRPVPAWILLEPQTPDMTAPVRPVHARQPPRPPRQISDLLPGRRETRLKCKNPAPPMPAPAGHVIPLTGKPCRVPQGQSGHQAGACSMLHHPSSPLSEQTP